MHKFAINCKTQRIMAARKSKVCVDKLDFDFIYYHSDFSTFSKNIAARVPKVVRKVAEIAN